MSQEPQPARSSIPDIQTFFKYGLDREIPALAQDPYPNMGVRATLSLELGPGKKKKIPTDIKLGLPDWRAPDRFPLTNGSVHSIHAYQFFEHLTGFEAVQVLKECDRVLCEHGVLNIVTPYYSSAHQAQALDHKSFWSEETWNWLFGNEYYDDHSHEWGLRVHTCFIMGIVERNLDLFTQLTKGQAYERSR